MNQPPDRWSNVRAQFDALPYPNQPLEKSPKDNLDELAVHNCAIPFYLRDRRAIDPKDKSILDAGCGSGYKLLSLAFANPGARLVGVDISNKSIEFVRKRLEFHQVEQPFEAHCLSLEDLPALGQTFDYINCEDVLYLLDDPVEGLKAMKAVLKPNGIIRVNMHSARHRAATLRMQTFFSHFGCRQGPPTSDEIALTRQTMSALHDWVIGKRLTWKSIMETNDETLLANHLLRGDKGITMQEFSALLARAGLGFISMVEWPQWNLERLFKNPDDVPLAVALGIAEMSLEEQHELFELLHPAYRLLDLYCGHPQANTNPPGELADWSNEQWQRATVHLHPQLRNERFQQALEISYQDLAPIPLDRFVKQGVREGCEIDASLAILCLHPLIEAPQPVRALVERWLALRPRNPISLEPTSPSQVFDRIRGFLTTLEAAGYLMIESPT